MYHINQVSSRVPTLSWSLSLSLSLSLSQVLLDDLFGTPAEEREAVVIKVPESRSPQSLNSFELLARFLSPSLLPSLLEPVKEVCLSVCH